MKMIIRETRRLLLSGVLLLTVSSAWAFNLQEVKSEGMVKENASGYLEVVNNADKSLTSFVKDINAKRKAKYSAIAKRNNISLSVVEKQAAKKLMK